MDVKDIAGLSEPIKKLIKTVSNGIGAIFEPYLIKKKGEANLAVIEKLAQVVKENPQTIRATKYEYEGLSVMLGSCEADILSRAETREQYKSIRKQANIENIISQSAMELECDDGISNKEVDEDWAARYFNVIEDVSDELMQRIWAKVLAGELRKPGSYSLRTLDILRNLSKNDANLFNKIASYALNINNNFCLLNPQQLSDIAKEVTYAEIIILQDLGLLSGSEASLNLQLNETSNNATILFDKKIIMIELNQGISYHCDLQVLPFSKVGSELLAFTDTSIKQEYISKICSLIKSDDNKTKIYIADINKRHGDKISYVNRKEVT